jgi:hypothetical protein
MSRKPTRTRCVLCSRIRRIVRILRFPNSVVQEVDSESMLAELRYRKLKRLYEHDTDSSGGDEG